MSGVIELAVGLLFFGVLLSLGWGIGSAIERNHLRSLDRRESELSNILLSDMKRLPDNWQATPGVLVHGEAVIATDYFKVFQGGILKLFGGRIRCYETLVDRARREAIVRMLENTRVQGANVVWNVRLSTATISGQQNQPGGVEVVAYGTAFRVTSKAV